MLLWILALSGCQAEESIEAIRQRQAEGDFRSTVEPLRELLRAQPGDAETNFLYGRALVTSQRPELALFSLREAMNDPNWLERAGIQIAVASLVTGDFNEAIAATTQILADDPENVDALLYRAQARAHWRNDPALALADAERVLELAPDRLEAYEPRILALLALDQPDEATEILAEAGRRLVAIDATADALAWHCNTTAIFAMDMGEPERAEVQLEECLERYPGNPFVVDTAIRFFDARGDFARSLEIIRHAHASQPASRTFRTTLANRIGASGALDEAVTLLRSAAEAEEVPLTAAALWADLGEFLHSAGRLEPAAAAFGEAMERNQSGDPQLTFRYADALVLAGELETAEEQIPKLAVEAHRFLIAARVAQERGDHDKALEGFLAASQLWPDNPWARYFAALSAEQLGQWDRALEEYRYSIRIHAGSTDARTRAARLLAAQGDLSGAYHVLFLQAEDFPLGPEGLVLGAYLVARVSNASQLQDVLLRNRASDPASFVRGLARAAEGLGENDKPAAGLNLLASAPGIDWAQASAIPALSTLVRLAQAAGQSDRAREFLTSLRQKGDVPPGRLEVAAAQLDELEGLPHDELQRAYLEAAELEPDRPEGWQALGQLTLEKNAAQALVWFDRAVQADSEEAGVERGRARALRALGRLDEAADLLDRLLEEDPLDWKSAIAHVELDLSREQVTARTSDLARRGVRFGRRAEDYRRLARVYRSLGDAARALSAEKAIDQIESAAAS